MKFTVSFLLTGLISFLLCLYFPWWTIAIVAAAVNALLNQRPLPAFLSAFSAIFLLWALMAWLISAGNDHILAHRLAHVILKSDSPGSLFMLTGLIGGLVAGLAGLAGSLSLNSRTAA